ncbi:MAG: hypothetical protein KF833_04730 [Verrucomicrobiae bacterium]|nr:hypothetical protein [Verrucomicrobiae bacterium]
MRTHCPSLVALALLAVHGGVVPESLGRSPRPSAPLFDNLGRHHHPITTRSPLAQRYFNQGMVLLYGFNHAEAIRSFQAVAELDPACAMAHWGIAYAHGPNINRPMEPGDVPQAWNALQKAQELAPQAGPREQAYIAALAERYRPEPLEDRSALDLAYADAMREVMRRFPDDTDAAALFAEALMDTMPWDYWQPDRRPKPATIEVIAVLRNVLRRDPDHPGAHHFFIHAVEAGPTPEDALPSADRLRALRLGAGHLVHMPSHIYIRTGRYADAIAVNAEATKIDQRYIDQCRAQGFYPATYYPHNLHFLWFAQTMAGRGQDAEKTARRIEVLEADVRCGPFPLMEAPRFRHLTILTLARFGRWDALVREPRPGEDNPLDLALWHFAHGLAAVAGQRAEVAGRHLAEMNRIDASPALKAMDSPILPATQVFGIARAILSGKAALARGETGRGLDHLRRAVELEDELPYMEPPFWHAPARQTLGAALLDADFSADAEAVFRADLDRNPRNGWSLFGLQESLRRQRRIEAADAVGREFARSWEQAQGPLRFEWY